MPEPLEQLFTGYWRFLAVRTACKLGLPEQVAAGVCTVTSLASNLSCDPEAMDHLVRALLHAGYLEGEAGGLKLSSEAERLLESHPSSLKHACLLWGAEHMDAWQMLDESIRRGASVFPMLFGYPFFQYLGHHPDRAREYHQAMADYARQDYAGIGKVLDLSTHRSVIDVGGSNGALVASLRKDHPEVAFKIFDLQDHRISEVHDVPFLQGDFFVNIPSGSDALLLSRVVHDWDDPSALRILNNCREALDAGGAVYLIENDLGMLGDGGHLLSLNMLAICGSRERSIQAYGSLLSQAGFLDPSITHHGHHAILKAKRS